MEGALRGLAALRMRAARVRQRRAGRREPREELVARWAPGRSFADVGAMWSIDGAISFRAEEAGAAAVTAVDVMEPTERFEAERARRVSRVRFVRADIHDRGAVSEIGIHDVVWCSGVLYHSPDPLTLLRRLRAITGEVLLLATETIPEVPGLEQACVFYPGLGEGGRRVHAVARPGVTAHAIHTPFEPGQGYSAWWWGMSASAVEGMLGATGFEVLERFGGPLHATLVARAAEGPA